MRMRIPLVAVLALFVAVSCDQQPAAPQADQVAELPTLTFINGPQNPGNSPIDREFDEWCFWCATTDVEKDFYATHQSAWEYFCNAGPTVQWDYQEINNGRLIINAQTRDQPLFIYDMSDFFATYAAGDQEAWCTYLADEWLYEGTHDMTATESWAGEWIVSEGHQQMIGNGQVHDHAGNQYKYSEKQKWMTGKGWTGWTHEYIKIR